MTEELKMTPLGSRTSAVPAEYLPLHKYLDGRYADTVVLTFSEVEDIIGNIPLNSIFNGCASGSNPEYCDQVVRTPFGTLFGDTIGGGGYIVGTNANVAKATFQGVDAQGSYRFDIGRLGSLVASLNAVYIIDTKTLPVEGALEFDCAGLYGNQCGPATPDWRHSLRLSWQFLDNIEASLQWRYIDSVTHEQNTSQPALQVRDENGDLVRVQPQLEVTAARPQVDHPDGGVGRSHDEVVPASCR